MNTKKFLITFIVVFVLLMLTGYIIHGAILASNYQMDEVKAAFRPEAEMNSNMWLIWITDLIWAFFFTFFFVKGYEGRGIMEGLRFGFYMGIFRSLVDSMQGYAVTPIPFSLALQWFVLGMIQMLILGLAAALLYKPREVVSAQAATV
jgi:hypothetical protein